MELEELRHVCKFCGKSFGCGRSLGGHMRSHMINDTSAMAADGTKLTRKKLPPLSTYLKKKKSVNTISGPGYVLRDNPRPSSKFSDPSEDGNDLDMSCMVVVDSQSDNETTAAPSKRKRSKRRMTRYTGPANSSSMSFANNASSSASEVDQEQEEVAMCLILLSRDVGQWGGSNSNSPALDSSDNRKTELVEGEDQGETKEIGIDEADEVVLKRKSIDSFDPEIQPEALKKFKDLSGEGGSIKFECTTCNKVFHSYQALGGHRASHNKSKGCFASKIDSSQTSIETESSPDPVLATECEDRADSSNWIRKSRGHECPICLKVFPSGQALGGHKRAHLVGAHNDLHHQPIAAASEPEHIVLDLNLPAPAEEESNGLVGFNPWWLGSNLNCEPLLELISN